LKHVRDAWIDQDHVDAEWRRLNYVARPDFEKALDEYDAFVELLRSFGIEFVFLPATAHDEGVGLDSVYVRDASIVTDAGVVLCSMGKKARGGEPALQGRHCRDIGVHVIGAITGAGLLEGGDVAWLDGNTLAVARGYRTNDDGIMQLKHVLGPHVDVQVMHAPHYRGPGDVFHLMSVISPIADDLALVYSPLMSVSFRQMLLHRRIELVEVPEEEFESFGCNALAVAPRVCVLAKGNSKTVERLRSAGVTVFEFDGDEICRKGCGGPTCLTRPLERKSTALGTPLPRAKP
jgi:N-dimethylarginine dimethylaminohydrolase